MKYLIDRYEHGLDSTLILSNMIYDSTPWLIWGTQPDILQYFIKSKDNCDPYFANSPTNHGTGDFLTVTEIPCRNILCQSFMGGWKSQRKWRKPNMVHDVDDDER